MIDIVRVMRETTVARAEHHPSVASTNDRAAECAARGVKDLPLVVVADEQTAGRGRGSNRWWTGQGGLAFSMLVDPSTVAADAGRSPLVSLASAVAVVEAVAPHLPDRPLGIHWPNDVMADGRKLAGILIEVLPDGRHVIGIGLNTNNRAADAPAELRNCVSTLRDLTGRELDQTTILIEVLRRLDHQFARLRDDARSVAARANELCLQRDQTLTINWGNRRTTGRCLGIAPDGALLLKTPTGVETFQAGVIE